MTFRTNPAPYQRSKNSTFKIMLILLAGLAVVWGLGIAYSFKLDSVINAFVASFNETAAEEEMLASVNYGIKAILNGVIAIVVSILCDVVISVIKQAKKDHKVDFKEVLHYVGHNYSYITGIIFALTLPVYASYYVIIIGSLFGTLICKDVFGGFGKNVFNPAIMARIFVGLCFAASLSVPSIISTVAKASETAFAVDAVSGATLTTAYKNLSGWMSTSKAGNALVIENVLLEGFTTKDLLLGTYVGALGETFTLAILVIGVVLSILGVINWRTPVFYLGTVSLTALVIALVTKMNPGLYVLAHLSLGGLAFGAVFMLTDPVTGPTSTLGKTIAAVFAGFMTVLIRIKGGYPEGVMYSIALANLISPAIDYLLKGKTNHKYGLKLAGLAVAIIALVGCNTLIGYKSASHIGATNAYGVNYAEEAKLQELVSIDGSYAKAEGYQIKTSKLVEFSYDDENPEDKLDAVYLVKDASGNTIAYGYMVKDSYSIVAYEGPTNVSCTAFVVINTEGKLVGMNYLTTRGPSTGSSFKTASIGVTEGFYGMSQQEIKSQPDVINGVSYSTKFIKLLVEDAYAEFNAK